MTDLRHQLARALPTTPRRPRRQLAFYARAIAWAPRTLRRYRREVVRLLAEVSFGTGALAVVGGTVGVIAS